MPKVRVKIDKTSLFEEMGRGRNRRIMNNTIAEVVRQQTNEARVDLIKDFEDHPVTKEVDGGGSIDNISNTIVGSGNLFNFIGFPQGSSPLAFTRKLFNSKIKTKVKKSFFRKGLFTVSTNIPPQEYIEEKARMPWASGLSWMRGIEEGISNIANFLNKVHPNSRSGRGLQVDKQMNKSFRPTKYMTEIYKKFYERIRK